METRIPGFPSWVEAEHAEDLQYLFGKPFSTPLVYFPRHRDLSGFMMAYWTNFAQTGWVLGVLRLLRVYRVHRASSLDQSEPVPTQTVSSLPEIPTGATAESQWSGPPSPGTTSPT